MIRTLDIEIHTVLDDDSWAQGRYLVHGHNDSLWTDDLEAAIAFIRESAAPEND